MRCLFYSIRKQLTTLFVACLLFTIVMPVASVAVEDVVLDSMDSSFYSDVLSDSNDFQIENGVLISYHGNGGFVHIPEGVTKISDSAFMAATSIQALYIPDSVTIIEGSAFAGCSNLKAIRFSKAIESVGNFAFLGCNSLTSVRLPASLEAISKGMFSECSNLSSIFIERPMKTVVGYGAFNSCTSLKSIFTVGTSLEANGDELFATFYGVPSSLIIYYFNTSSAWSTSWHSYSTREAPKSVLSDMQMIGSNTIEVGESRWLSTVIKNVDAIDGGNAVPQVSLSWSSSNPNIATVDEFEINNDRVIAYLVAKQNGTTIITATLKNGINSITVSQKIKIGTQTEYERVEWEGHQYQVFDDASTWVEAKKTCEDRGGHLATITSAEEDTFLFDYIKKCGFGSVYFGLTDEEEEGVWEWVTGEPYAYSNWAPGEDNDEFGNEDYGMYYYKFPEGQWNDGSGDGHAPYICEWTPQEPIVFPILGEKDARYFLGFIYNDSDLEKMDLSQDPYYNFLIGSSTLSDDDKHKIALSFLQLLDSKIHSHLGKSQEVSKYLLGSLTSYFTKQLGNMQEIPEQEYNSFLQTQVETLQDFMVDCMVAGVAKGTGIIITEEVFENLKLVSSTCSSILDIPGKVEKFVDGSIAVIQGSLLPLQAELGGRYQYFDDYLRTRAIFDKSDLAFKIRMNNLFLNIKESNLYKFGELINCIPGKSSWDNNLSTIERWAEFTYQLQLSLDDHSQNSTFADGTYKMISVQCPVNIYLYNAQSQVIGSIINGTVTNMDGAHLYLDVLNDAKIICIKNGYDYKLEIVPYNSGTMTYSMKNIDNHQETLRNNIYKLPLHLEKTYVVNPLVQEGNYDSLSIVSIAGEPTVTIDSELIKMQESRVTITLQPQDGGDVSGGGVYTQGDYVVVHAAPETGYLLDGWYEDGKKVSSQSIYAFTAIEGRSLDVRFTPESTIAYGLSIQNGLGGGNFTEGTQVSITADAAPSGKVFDRWITNNGGNFADVTSPSTIFTMPGNTVTVMATYRAQEAPPAPTYVLTLLPGSGGRIIIGVSGQYASGDIISIAATPNTNYRFSGWTSSGGGSFANTLDASTTFTMPAGTTTVTANFTYTGDDASSSGSSGKDFGDGSVSYSVDLLSSMHGIAMVTPKNAGEGSIVTITIKPEDGYELDELIVTDKDGINVNLTSQGVSKYTFTMPESNVHIRALFVMIQKQGSTTTQPFTDVASGTWYTDAVDYVCRRGLMSETSATTFSPDDDTTRGMIVTILYHLEGTPAVSGLPTFADDISDSYSRDAIFWAFSRGVIKGYDNGLFGPDDTITREQLTVILWRYSGSPAAANTDLNFADASETGGFAQEALCWAVEQGIVLGKGGGILDPKGTASRAEVATMLMRYLRHRMPEA